MKPLLCVGLLLAPLTACSGLYSRNPDGGNMIITGLGPPTCMRVLSDSISVQSPSTVTDVIGLAFDRDRNLHVLNRQDDASFVNVMGAPSYGLLRTYGKGSLGPVRDLVLDAEGNAYIVENFESGPPKVKKFDATGKLILAFTADATTQDEGLALAIDGTGLLNIAGVSKIYRYDLNGAFVDAYGLGGEGVGRVLLPVSLAWDNTTQSMWVADIFQNFVERYSPGNSTQLAQFGGRGVANGKFDGTLSGKTFYGPNRVAVDAEGKIYASDPFSSRLQKFAPNGSYLGQFDLGTTNLFGAIAIHPDTGVLYVGSGSTIHVICPY